MKSWAPNIRDDDVLYTLKMGKPEQVTKRMKVVYKEVTTKQQVSKLKTKLKKQNLWISDVLTPFRMNLAYLARKAVREKKIAQRWVYDGKISLKQVEKQLPKRFVNPRISPISPLVHMLDSLATDLGKV